MKLAVGLVGPVGCGKGSSLVILREFFPELESVSLSDIIREYLETQGLIVNRNTLHSLGNSYREKYGPDFWMQQALKKLSNCDTAVFDGIRNMSEIECLRMTVQNTIILGFPASEEVRLERLLRRNRDVDPQDPDDVKIMMEQEMFDEGGFGFQLQKCLDRADYSVNANLPLDDFYVELRRIVSLF